MSEIIDSMQLNTINFTTVDRKLLDISQALSQVELFFAGVPVSSVRIKDASITNAKIANLSVVNANFANLAITNAKITSVDATDITVGTLSADRIASSSITADKLDVTELSAISADVGTLTAGTIQSNTVTGGLVRTASSGARVELNSSGNVMTFFDGSNNTKIKVDANGIYMNGITVDLIGSGPVFKARLGRRSTGDLELIAFANDLVVGNSTGSGKISLVSASGRVYFGYATNTVYINGTPKTAIVETDAGYKALYCAEAPDVWLMDFAKDESSIDPLFLEVTEGESNILKTDQNEILVFRRRKGFAQTRFEQKTVEQFNKNNAFWGNV